MSKKQCKDCGLPPVHHIQTWIDECINTLLPPIPLSKRLNSSLVTILTKALEYSGLIKLRDDFLFSEIQMRSACFIDEARKRGIIFKAEKGPSGYTNHFYALTTDKKIHFESLPSADHESKYDISFVDCKERTKKHLKKGNFPIAEGKSFWFWQKEQATRYGVNDLGFPLVVKPRGGSVARHVTTHINNEKDLQRAIDWSIAYSPAFIIERFMKGSPFVYRATVVDFNYVACVKQVPANIVGDGTATIQELVNKKNKEECRGEPHQKEFTLYKIAIDDTTKKLLAEKGYTMQTIPRRYENVYVQKNPFLKLGGDLVEVTEKVHSENMQLFKDIAKFFDNHLVGIDFLVPDIALSWKKQKCAILELNSIPCIEMHHAPSSGTPQNVASAVTDLFFKYYT
jgi:cyanophycin synthetase